MPVLSGIILVRVEFERIVPGGGSGIEREDRRRKSITRGEIRTRSLELPSENDVGGIDRTKMISRRGGSVANVDTAGTRSEGRLDLFAKRSIEDVFGRFVKRSTVRSLPRSSPVRKSSVFVRIEIPRENVVLSIVEIRESRSINIEHVEPTGNLPPSWITGGGIRR